MRKRTVVARSTLTMLWIAGILLACSEEGDRPVNRSDLYGVWSLQEHIIDGTSYPEYLQIHKAVNFTTNTTLWVDTIYFGQTQFEFLPCGEPCILMNANIRSAAVRVLNGSWRLDMADTLTIQSLVTTSMTQDTIINTHKYSFFDLVNNLTFTVIKASDSNLTLRAGTQALHFIRVD